MSCIKNNKSPAPERGGISHRPWLKSRCTEVSVEQVLVVKDSGHQVNLLSSAPGADFWKHIKASHMGGLLIWVASSSLPLAAGDTRWVPVCTFSYIGGGFWCPVLGRLGDFSLFCVSSNSFQLISLAISPPYRWKMYCYFVETFWGSRQWLADSLDQ